MSFARRVARAATHRAWLGVALLTVCAAGGAHAEPSAQAASASRTDSPIVLDGRLSEAAWSSTVPVTTFFEIYPGNATAANVETEGRFLYDGKNLYVGIRAHDPAPDGIRSSLVRRDQVTADQDYVEVLIDAQGQRSGALLFRTNPASVATDAQFNDDTQARDFSPDFNFDVRAVIDELGWMAEFRVPLSTLRYRPGDGHAWTFVIHRNRPRGGTQSLATIPAQRSTNCSLCLAAELTGIGPSAVRAPLHVTPYVAYSATQASDGLVSSDAHEERTGIDAKWQPAPGTVVDLTVAPDFSQVEADALQLGANTLFALSSVEKRPFFLEGTDLLATPVPAVYTRAFAEPQAGIRLTRRGNQHDYTALVLRNGAGDRLLEPSAISSRAATMDSESTAVIARFRRHGESTNVGALATSRSFDDGGHNVVVGTDAVWTPSLSDRVSAQVLWSQTQDPDRPDLIPSWTGQSFNGGAGSLSWSHTGDLWTGSLGYAAYSGGFRAWNGFVSQVDMSRVSVTTSLRFFPENPFVVRVAPTLSFSRAEQVGGEELNRNLTSSLSIEMPRATVLTLSWTPVARSTSLAGLRSSDTLSASFSTTPAAWMPGLTLSGSVGDSFEVFAGDTGDFTTWRASLPLRLFGRLELNASAAHQSLEPQRANAPERSLFKETNREFDAIWHLSGKLYVQAAFQEARLTRPAALTGMPSLGSLQSARTHASGLLSYRANWQTRYFVGFRRVSNDLEGTTPAERDDTEIFAKVSYVFSM